jgi:hypothetical protein
MNNTPDSPAKSPDDRMDQGGNHWTLLPLESGKFCTLFYNRRRWRFASRDGLGRDNALRGCSHISLAAPDRLQQRPAAVFEQVPAICHL